MTEEDVLITDELSQRPPRKPNWELENLILRDLSRHLNKPPKILLKYFTEIALKLCKAGTAGVSMIETDGEGKEFFRWVSLTGVAEEFEGATFPCDFSPCGMTIKLGSPQLYFYPSRVFTYLDTPGGPMIVEALIAPMIVEEQNLGTIWIVLHQESEHRFDQEDLRIMNSLAEFLAMALSNARMRQELQERAHSEQVARAEAQAANRRLELVLANVNNSFVVLNMGDAQSSEQTLRQKEDLFHQMAETIEAVFWMSDPLQGQLLYVSPAYERIWGRDRQNLASDFNKFLDAIHIQDRDLVRSTWLNVLSQERFEIEYRIVRPDKEIRWVRDRGFLLRDNGMPTRLIGFTFDITERKQAEIALRESEEKFRNMADNSPVMVWVTDSFGNCSYLSRSWYEFSGQCQETGSCCGWLNGVHPQDRLITINIFERAYEAQEAFQLECRIRRFDGEYRTCINAGSPWFGVNREFKGYVGSVLDITERKQAEQKLKEKAKDLSRLNDSLIHASQQLEARNKELDSFTYIVSHDLKAPLKAITNLSEWIEEDLKDKLDEKNQHLMKLLRDRTGRMEGLIDGLLAYSRVGRNKVDLKPVDVRLLIEEIIDSLSPPSSFKITIDLNLAVIDAKRLLLSQVLTNLIGNAIKHHPRSDGHIHIIAEEKELYYEFAITDDGDGIASQHHTKIFNIFQTLISRDVKDSSGIGLSIVKKIVETEGGEITLESDLGCGATFSFTWPKQPLV